MPPRYDWRCGGERLVCGTWSDAWWAARAQGLRAGRLVAHDPATGAQLFERPAAAAASFRALRRPPRYAQDVNRWGRVVTRVELRPLPSTEEPYQRSWHFLRGGRKRKYMPVPNCFDRRWHLCAT